MKAICSVFLILSVCFITYSHARETSSEEYIIQKSDTLWGISDSRLQDPFLWPRLWNSNPHISNPDLIYPGEKIIIPSREELMRLPESPEEKQLPSVKKFKTPAVAVAPPAGDDLKGREPYKRYLADKNLYVSLGWIAERLPGIGEITSILKGGEIAGKNDIVYVNISQEKSLSGQGFAGKPLLVVSQGEKPVNRFFSIRDIKTVNHPVTGKMLGHLIRVTGVIEIIGTDNNIPKAKILRSFEDVQTGDRLIRYQEIEPPLAPDIIRTPNIEGYVVQSLSGNELSAKGDIVFLDKGLKDGLQAGDIFSVFSGSPVARAMGKVQVLSLQSATSAALILKSYSEIIPGLTFGQE